MAEIWQLSLNEFLGDWITIDYDEEFERACVHIVNEQERKWARGNLIPVFGHDNLYCCHVIGDNTSFLLIMKDSLYLEYDVVGGYVDETLWIDSSLRGKGLASELIIHKANSMGGFLKPITYTPMGKKSHIAAHRLAVSRALQQGYRVPEKALHACHIKGN